MEDRILENAYDYLMRYKNTEKKLLGANVFFNMRVGKGKAEFYNEDLPRILMFGSFKAGKSTLVNALTGRKLAAVGPFEKTSWIARYWPSEEEFCYIEKKDGTIEEISISEFVKNTQADAYEKEYLSSIYRVDIGYKSTECTVALIDTPGIGAKQENELRALESVGDADLIFYMVDVNKLGKMREHAIVNAIRETNTPMVCIATKYDDDIAEDVEYGRVKKMVAKYTGFDEKDIYPVSVRNYLEDENDSYFETIINLCKEIQIKKKDHRRAAQQANLFRQTNSILSYYQKLRGEINNITGSINGFQKQFFHYQKIINDELSVFIKDYVRKTLYAEHKENIVQVIELSLDRDDDERNAILSRILPFNYLDCYMEKLSKIVTEKQYELWNEKVSEVAAQYRFMMQGLLDNKMFNNMSFSDVEAISNLGHNEKAFRDNGVKWSLGIAGFASFYEAVLGANAASVLLAGAAFTTGLPLAAGGLILTSYLLKQKKESGVTKSIIRGAVEKEIANFGNSVSEYCINRIEDHDRDIFSSYIKTLDAEIQSYFPVGKMYVDEIADCDCIINKLRSFAASIEFADATNDEEIALRKKNRQLEEERNGLSSEITSIKEKYSSEIQSKDEQISDLEANNGSLSEQIREKENQIEALTSECYQKESEINALMEKKAELEKDQTANKEAISKLSKEISGKETDLKDKNTEIARIGKERDKLQKSNEKKQSEIKTLREEKIELEKTHRIQMSDKQKELEAKVDEISALRKEISSLRNSEIVHTDEKRTLEQNIIAKLDIFIHLGNNKYRFSKADKVDVLMRVGLEDLILFKDDELDVFLDDLKVILKYGLEYKTDGLEIIKLVSHKYIFGRKKMYRAYCRLEGNTFSIKCVDVWNKDEEKYRTLKEKLGQTSVIEDDELKYRIFDEMRRAKKQVVIATPWITQKAWSEKGNYKYSFEEVISNLFIQNKDIKVYIVTGNSGDISSKSDNDKETQDMVEFIKDRFAKWAGNRLKIYGDCIIHDKILVIDDSFSMLGSYNMLSNQCLYREGYDRQGESMHISENPINVLRDLERASVCAKQDSDYFGLELK